MPEHLARSLKDGALATFQVKGEVFRIWTNDAHTMEQLKNLTNREPVPGIPAGPVSSGAGFWDFNAPWSWHFDPATLVIADTGEEECDGTPSDVEQYFLYYNEVVGRYCPLEAVLLDVTFIR